MNHLKPMPLGVRLEIGDGLKQIKGRKVLVETTVPADGVATATAGVVAAQTPDRFGT